MIVAVDGEKLSRSDDLADVISAKSAGRRGDAATWSAGTPAARSRSSWGNRPEQAARGLAVVDLVRELALALREQVLPHLGSHAGRVHEEEPRRAAT